MKIFMLVATVATFTVDLSQARSIAKREAATVIGLPIQRFFRPLPGSTVSTGNTNTNFSRDPITSRHYPRSRRAVSDDSESDDDEEEEDDDNEEDDNEEEDVPEQQTISKSHLGGQVVPVGYSSTRKQEYEESSTEDYATRLSPFGDRASTEPSYLSFSSTPVASTLTTMAPPIDVAPTLKSFSSNTLSNLDFSLIPPPVTPLSEDLTVPKSSKMWTKANTPSMNVSGNGSGVTNHDKMGAVNSKNIGKDVNTKNKVVTVQKTKSDGTPLIIQIYINQSPEEPDTKQPDTKESDLRESDMKELNTKGPKTKGSGSTESDTKKPNTNGSKTKGSDSTESDTKKPNTNGSKTKGLDSTGLDTKELNANGPKMKEPGSTESDTKEPNTKKPKTEEVKTKESDAEESDAEEPDTEEPNTKEPDTTDTKKAVSTKPGTTKPNTTKPDTTKPGTTKPDTTKPERKSNKMETSKEEPSPGKIRHGDYMVFSSTGAKQGKFSTASIEIKDEKFGKITLSPEVVDLITRKGKPEKETRDNSNFTPSPSEQGPQRRRTINFRA